MFNVRLARGHRYGKQLFTWLSLVVSLMASFVLSFFPLDVLDEIGDLIESVSEGFLTYSCTTTFFKHSYLISHRQVPFHTWNIIILYYYLSLQNTILQGKALGWGLMGQN